MLAMEVPAASSVVVPVSRVIDPTQTPVASTSVSSFPQPATKTSRQMILYSFFIP
jgi:hypothetical protein